MAVHGNVEVSLNGLFALVEEVKQLKVIQKRADVAQMFVQMQEQVDLMLKEAKRNTGFDLLTDLGSFTASLHYDPASKAVKYFGRLRGNFPAERVEALFKDSSPGIKRVTYMKKTLYVMRMGTSKDPAVEGNGDGKAQEPEDVYGALVLMDDSTVLFGDLETVKGAMNKKDRGLLGGTASRQLRSHVGKDSWSWLYVRGSKPIADLMRSDRDLVRVADQLETMEFCTFVSSVGGARFGCNFVDPAGMKTVEHLMRAGAIAVSTTGAGIEMLYHAALGVVPLLSEREVPPELLDVLGDEEAMDEVRGWLLDHFAGVATVSSNESTMEVVMEMSVPGGLGLVGLPFLVGLTTYGYLMF